MGTNKRYPSEVRKRVAHMVFEHQGEHDSQRVPTVVPLRIWLQTAENTHPVFLSYLASLIAVGGFAVPLTWAFGLPGLLAGMIICAAIALGVMWRGVIAIRRDLKAEEVRS